MTVSKEQRLTEMRDLLVKLTEHLGDRYYFEVTVGIREEPFDGFLTTTWLELERRGYLEGEHGFGPDGVGYSLTAAGWLKGLQLSGGMDSPTTRQRAVTLVRALKALVKGRDGHHDQIADERDLAPETGLPAGWIHNALASNLLNELFPGDDMTIRYDYRNKCFRVPMTFGMDPLERL